MSGPGDRLVEVVGRFRMMRVPPAAFDKFHGEEEKHWKNGVDKKKARESADPGIQNTLLLLLAHPVVGAKGRANRGNGASSLAAAHLLRLGSGWQKRLIGEE